MGSKLSTLAFVFPGQGSQSVGMLGQLAGEFPIVEKTFDEASDRLGFDLWELVSNGPEDALADTRNTQPAMLTSAVAVWRVWSAEGGPLPKMMAGHSLGEYSALVCSEALAFADAVTVVRERGRLMHEAVPAGRGAMAAILGLPGEAVRTVCAEAAEGQVLEAVNYNTPEQTVVAGNSEAVDRGVALAKSKGAKRALRLPVSVPSHCALMRPAAESLAELLKDVPIRAPVCPVVNNVDAAQPNDPAAIRDALVRQLYSPVRWVEIVQELKSAGIDTVVEGGPGKVLVGLQRRIDREMTALPIHDGSSLGAALETFAGDRA